MISTRREPGAHRRDRTTSRRLRAALALGAVAGLGITGTHAYWTDAVTVTGATFSTGTIDLEVDDSDGPVTFSTLALSAMVPGNTAAGVLTVRNAGTTALRYTATSVATNADGKNLAGALTLKVTGAGTVTGTAPQRTCAGTALAGTGSALVGSPVSTGRLLAAGASETLCFQVTLPATAPSALQGAATTATLTFTGTTDLS